MNLSPVAMDPDGTQGFNYEALIHGILLLPFIYFAGWSVYSLYFHPLSRYPGPKLAAISPMVHILWDIRGKQHSVVERLHDQYGSVVRIAPNALVYNSAAAWKDIYGHRKKGQKLFVKDPALYSPTPNGTNAIITANDEQHSRMRRLLTHAFSNNALQEQEHILHVYADMLIDKLAGILHQSQRAVVDMNRWYNFTTFDVIGDLAFGEPFGCLSENQYHWWVMVILDAVKASAYLKVFWFYPTLLPLFILLVPRHLLKKRKASFKLTVEKVRRRLARQTTRPDFTSYIIKHGHGGRGLSLSEIDANAGVFVLAGSETTAALLTGCTYYLLRHHEKYIRLVREIRGAFAQVSEIKLSALVALPYLNAVLTETLRIYPPIPSMLPRLVPQGGAIIDGRYVPAGVSVSISLYSAFHSNVNFNDPNSFIPERWLPGPESSRFASDQKDAFQPFSYGPRNCLGQHLANAEMRLILAKFLWRFDLELQPESQHWSVQNSFALWSRPALWVKLCHPGTALGAASPSPFSLLTI